MPRSTTNRKLKPKRQPNGEGTPSVLPSGLIRYTGVWNGHRVCGSAKPTYEEAKATYREKLAQLQAPVSEPEPEMPCVEEYMAKVIDGPWRNRLRHKTMAPSTWQMAEQILRLNVVGTPLGLQPLGKVCPSDLERWAAKLITQERVTRKKIYLPRPLGNTSKRRYLGMLDSIFEHARKQEKLIQANPVRDVLKPAEDEVEFRTLNGVEVEELLKLCDKENPDETNSEYEKVRRLESNRRRRRICLLGLHGYGPAESCGSRYEDFDGEGLWARRQRQRLRELGVVERDQLKTKARKAWVAVDDDLKAILSETKEGYILATSSDKPMEPANLRRTFAGMVKGTKFEGMTPYDLRHTFAQRLLDENVDVKTAAELMRHSVEVFLDRYVRSDRARKLAAIKKLNASKIKVESPDLMGSA
jgi:integrase